MELMNITKKIKGHNIYELFFDSVNDYIVFRDDWGRGILIPIQDVKSLAQEMIDFMDNLNDRL